MSQPHNLLEREVVSFLERPYIESNLGCFWYKPCTFRPLMLLLNNFVFFSRRGQFFEHMKLNVEIKASKSKKYCIVYMIEQG